MADQPVSGGAGAFDPFQRLSSILCDRHNHLVHTFTTVFADRMAFRVVHPNVQRHAYVLADADGAVAAASHYLRQFTTNPAPHTYSEFDAAVTRGRAFAAAGGISFADLDPVFRGAEALWDRMQMVIVLSPSAIRLPGERRVGPIQLRSVWIDEFLETQWIYERLSAFSIHVQSDGIIPKTTIPTPTEPEPSAEQPLSERQYDALDAIYELKAFMPDTRVTTEDVAERLDLDPAKLKEPIAALVESELLASKKGRGGGVWLTEIGRKQIETQRTR